jgi:hypothetical protein
LLDVPIFHSVSNMYIPNTQSLETHTYQAKYVASSSHRWITIFLNELLRLEIGTRTNLPASCDYSQCRCSKKFIDLNNFVYLHPILPNLPLSSHVLNGNCPPSRDYEPTADGVPWYHILEWHFQFHTSPFLTPPLRCRMRGWTQTTGCQSVLHRCYGIREQWIHFCKGYFHVYLFFKFKEKYIFFK